MDRALALEKLGLAAEDWGPCAADHYTHAEFAAAWRGKVPCPGEAAIASAAGHASVLVVIESFKVKMQTVLDAAAHAEGFDNIFTAVTYADEPSVPEFQLRGKAFRSWRSRYWAAGEAIMADVLAGSREVPAWDKLLAELPAAPTFD